MDDLHGEVARRLRGQRQRYTDARRLLVDLLVDGGRPLTIPDLLDAADALTQSSTYRNLGVLEQAGVVRRLSSVDDAARFELAEDLSEHHHHVACRTCGRLEDVVLPPEVERQLEAVASAVSGASGYAVDAHRVELVGTCGDCG